MPAATATDGPAEAVALAPVRSNLLRCPLEFVVAEHHRLRALCQLLGSLAEAGHGKHMPVEAILHCIEHELPLHVLDEEEDLFPLIRRRALPRDGAERLLSMLARGLRARETAEWDEAGFRAAIGEFVRRQRRHITVENAVLIPLAEARLTAHDRQGLARRMAARRGIVLGEQNHG